MRRLLVLVSLLLVTPYFTGQNAKANDFLKRLEQKQNTQADLRTRWRSCIKDGTTRWGKSFQYAFTGCLNNVIKKARDIDLDLRDITNTYYHKFTPSKFYTDMLIWETYEWNHDVSYSSTKIDCENANYLIKSTWKVPAEGSAEEAAMIIYCSNP